jgi:hypothetical protein
MPYCFTITVKLLPNFFQKFNYLLQMSSSSAFVYSSSGARLFDTRETFSLSVKIYVLQS